MIDSIPHNTKIVLDVAAPATAGAYVFGMLPNTWGEWGAMLAGLWALIQTINFMVTSYSKYKRKKRRTKKK